MRAQKTYLLDHGAALRVPSSSDLKGREAFWLWLGQAGCPFDSGGAVQVSSVDGPIIALPGDWIVLSFIGTFHVARTLSDPGR